MGCGISHDDPDRRKSMDKSTGNPYDDVFRTLQNDCPELLIPVVNDKFPRSAVFYLRSTRNTPDSMEVQLYVPEDSCRYQIPAIKIEDYSVDDQRIFCEDAPCHVAEGDSESDKEVYRHFRKAG